MLWYKKNLTCGEKDRPHSIVLRRPSRARSRKSPNSTCAQWPAAREKVGPQLYFGMETDEGIFCLKRESNSQSGEITTGPFTNRARALFVMLWYLTFMIWKDYYLHGSSGLTQPYSDLTMHIVFNRIQFSYLKVYTRLWTHFSRQTCAYKFYNFETKYVDNNSRSSKVW